MWRDDLRTGRTRGSGRPQLRPARLFHFQGCGTPHPLTESAWSALGYHGPTLSVGFSGLSDITAHDVLKLFVYKS